MGERRSIFSARGDGERIGYTEGIEAFDLSGQRCCRYDEQTGNLCDLGNGKIVGHVSLKGRFVGLSRQADELFPRFYGNIEREVVEEEGFPNNPGEQVVGREPARTESEAPNNAESQGLSPLNQVLAVACEVFGQRDAKDDQRVRNAGEMPNAPVERGEPATPADFAGEQGGPFSEEVERVFERLRNRIGLSAS